MRTFFIIWLGQTASFLGSRITEFGFTLWIFEQTGQATDLALMGLSFGATTVLVNLFAGVIVDRFSRQRLIWGTDLLAGLITVAYLFLFTTNQLQIWHIYIGMACRGGLNVIQGLAYTTSIPLMVPPQQYVRTSAMQTITLYSGNIIGPGLGAFLYYNLGIVGIMWLDIITFIVAVITVLMNEIPQPERPLSPPSPAVQTLQQKYANRNTPPPRFFSLHILWLQLKHSTHLLFNDMTYGFSYIYRSPSLRALLLTVTFANFFDGFPNALLAPMILTRTNQNASILALASIGSGIGGITASVLLTIYGGPRRHRTRIISTAILGAGAAKTIVALSRSATGWATFSGFASATFPVRGSTDKSIWLEQVPITVQGRVLAVREIMHQFAFYAGFGLAAPLADYIFEPALATNGWLTPYLNWLIPAGPGAGFTFVLFCAVLGMALVGLVTLFSPTLHQLDIQLDTIPTTNPT
ncbi:MAG TPA: MFS transporter [Anaerolineae bacterium]|nr:MFS transporter [Anaerolineae bacterium]